MRPRRFVHAALALATYGALAACQQNGATGPGEITWDRDTCEHCIMAIGDRRFAAQVRDSREGRLHVFDDLGCALIWLTAEEPGADLSTEATSPELWVRDAAGQHWIDGRAARFGGGHQTPMGYGFGAEPDGSREGVRLPEVAKQLSAGEDERRHPRD